MTHRSNYLRSDRIVAYVYQADMYCPACVVEAMIANGIAAPAARDMFTEDVLDQCAGALAVDREDEASYDSDEFPKVVFADWVDEDVCGRCGETF